MASSLSWSAVVPDMCGCRLGLCSQSSLSVFFYKGANAVGAFFIVVVLNRDRGKQAILRATMSRPRAQGERWSNGWGTFLHDHLHQSPNEVGVRLGFGEAVDSRFPRKGAAAGSGKQKESKVTTLPGSSCGNRDDATAISRHSLMAATAERSILLRFDVDGCRPQLSLRLQASVSYLFG